MQLRWEINHDTTWKLENDLARNKKKTLNFDNNFCALKKTVENVEKQKGKKKSDFVAHNV